MVYVLHRRVNRMLPHVLLYDERWLRPDGAVRNWQVLRRECKAKADAGHIPCGHLSMGTPAVMKKESLLSGTSPDNIGKDRTFKCRRSVRRMRIIGAFSCSRSNARRVGQRCIIAAAACRSRYFHGNK